MMIKVALLHTSRSTVREKFEPVLRDMLAPAALTVLDAETGAPLQTMRRLLALRPQIVIAEAGAPHILAATLYRTVRPQSRLLLCASDVKEGKPKLRGADAFISDPSEACRAVERVRASVANPAPLPVLPDLDQFRLAPPSRAATSAHRLLYVGALSPASLAPDLLIALVAWAERHPYRTAEIWWAGDGDLSGVLAAQPLPPNLAQHFHRLVARPELASLMARCGVLVASADVPTEQAPIIEALAAGLVIVASNRITAARLLLQPPGPGWLFDPARRGSLAEALNQVLAGDLASLDELRAQGQRLACGGQTAARDVIRPANAEPLARAPLVTDGALT